MRPFFLRSIVCANSSDLYQGNTCPLIHAPSGAESWIVTLPSWAASREQIPQYRCLYE